MDQSKRYSAQELSDKIKSSGGAMRNQLIRLLLNKEDGRPFVNELLHHDDRKIRQAILQLLTPQNVSENIPVLVQLLENDDLSNQKIIIKKLGTSKNAAAERALLQRIRKEKENGRLLKLIIASLGNIGGIKSIKVLMKEFDRYNEDTKIAVLMALNKIKSNDAVPLYRQALHDPSADVRLWALKSLKPYYLQVDRNEIIKMIWQEEVVQNQAYAIRLLSRYNDINALDFMVSLLFDPNFISIKYDILKGLSKFSFSEVAKRFRKKMKEVHIEKEKKILEDALNYLRNELLLQNSEHPLYKTWIRDPVSFPDVSLLSFFTNNRGVYREEKAAEVVVELPFSFRMEKDNLFFMIGKEEKVVSFSISPEECDHPYEGKSPCLTLRFKGPDVYIGRINITGSSYYYLEKD